jgi:hypothetical protein
LNKEIHNQKQALSDLKYNNLEGKSYE